MIDKKDIVIPKTEDEYRRAEDEGKCVVDPWEEEDGKLWACTTYCESAPPRPVVLDAGAEFTDAMQAAWDHHREARSKLGHSYLGVDGKLPPVPRDALGGVADNCMVCAVCAGRARIYRINDQYRNRRGDQL